MRIFESKDLCPSVLQFVYWLGVGGDALRDTPMWNLLAPI